MAASRDAASRRAMRPVETGGELAAEVVKAALPNVKRERFSRAEDEGDACANPT